MPQPRPAAPAGSIPATTRRFAPTVRPLGSVKWDKQSIVRSSTRSSLALRVPTPDIPLNATYSYVPENDKHRVYKTLLRDKLLMGAEREFSQLNVMFVMSLILIALATFSWHPLPFAILYAVPVQRCLRVLSQVDVDFIKVYLDALGTPHMREAE